MAVETIWQGEPVDVCTECDYSVDSCKCGDDAPVIVGWMVLGERGFEFRPGN